MVQGITDPAKKPPTLSTTDQVLETSTSSVGHSAVVNIEQHQQHAQPQVVQSQLTTLTGTQRIALSTTLAGSVNVITSPFVTSSAVVTQTSSSSIASQSGQAVNNATYQHYLIPGVSIGNQLQNITIPAQVALSGVRTTNATQGQTVVGSPTSTYTISSPQSLARILAAAASQNYSVRAGTTARGFTAAQQSQMHSQSNAQLGGIQLQKVSTTSGSTMISLPVTSAAALQQQRVVNAGTAVLQGQDSIAVRLTPAQAAAVTQQHAHALQLMDSAHLQTSDVTKVHSYSVAKAIPSTSNITVGGAQLGHLVSQASLRQTHQLQQQRLFAQKQAASHSNVAGRPNVNSNIKSGSAQGVSSAACHVTGSLSNPSSQKSKRIKLEERPPPTEEIANMRKRVVDHKSIQFRSNKENYVEHLTELFFLQNGGNMMDYLAWKRRLTPQLLAFLKANALENDEEEEQRIINQLRGIPATAVVTSTVTATTPVAVSTAMSTESSTTALSKQLPHSTSSQAISASKHVSPLPSLPQPPTPIMSHNQKRADSISTSISWAQTSSKSPKITPLVTSVTGNRLTTRQHSISAVYDSSIGSQEEIVERAKQEAYVIQRIAELRKEGLWSSKRLPKVQEPPRAKAHWDYLIEEMIWLSTDFAQERKWKKAAAKKCARMVMKYHQEKEQKAEKAEKEEQLKLRKIASHIAKEIKQFWTNIEKLVEFKQQTRLDEKRKRALDLHLNFIVDQTEKYSSWLTQGMKKNLDGDCSITSQSVAEGKNDSESSQDEDFEPHHVSESDDEETIATEEAAAKKEKSDEKDELDLLQQDSEVPIEDLINSLPAEIFEKPASPLEGDSEESDESEADLVRPAIKVKQEEQGDDEYHASDEDEEDDEATIEAEEKQQKRKTEDYKNEMNDLQEEGNLTVEELYEKYAKAYESDFELPEDSEESSSESSSETSKDSEDEDVDVEGDSPEESEDEMMDEGIASDDDMEEIGMEYLIKDDASQSVKVEFGAPAGQSSKTPSKEISDIAAAAEQFQPKGNTLSTTKVVTKIPFLLKHTLREYQHIGLDWLVAMHDRKLNGILADEMGLGKTIQTISLLAHLACDKGNWGPHLIVVPTSVMLNWEMEFKKWCPGFKILTYYGSQKDRKQKRMGWTKPNAFHICITSYKLVVQDHSSFRRKKWKYFILDEAQHIKNFKSQRWQMLLNFSSYRRLLLTGTPLQNSLMELWSLMHFLMPNVFQSHREFREWFVNPVTGMVEGNHEYNEGLIKRLHKILRPFLLRRLKCEVEKQLPKKYEHVIVCRLSTRQRYLYEDFMSRTKTRETLASGSFLSVINILMQLRKVCNHPNLFEARPTVSPFLMEGIVYHCASLVTNCLSCDPFKRVSLLNMNLLLANLETTMTAFAAHRIRKFQIPGKLIEEIDSAPDPPPRCPPGKIRLHIRTSSSVAQQQAAAAAAGQSQYAVHKGTTPVATAFRTAVVSPAVLNSTGAGTPQQQKIVLMTNQNAALAANLNSGTGTTGLSLAQLTSLGIGAQGGNGNPITVQLAQGAKVTLPYGFGRLVQTASGQHLLLATPQTRTVNQDGSVSPATPTTQVMLTTTNNIRNTLQGGRMVTLSQPVTPTTLATSTASKPVLRVAPLNVNSAGSMNSVVSSTSSNGAVMTPVTKSVVSSPSQRNFVARSSVTPPTTPIEVPKPLEQPKVEKRRSLFYLDSLSQKQNDLRRKKLKHLVTLNNYRCKACPVYGQDLIDAVTIKKVSSPPVCSEDSMEEIKWKGDGYTNCLSATQNNPKQYWLQTEALTNLIRTPESLLKDLQDIIDRFVFVVPGVTAPGIQMHVSHPEPSVHNEEKLRENCLRTELAPRSLFLHRVISKTTTQFPELRLIQYDCGKLQILDKLLWQLKSGSHRVLIFTQMTRMLDVLEQFLNFHGHTYLRLDGSTRVDQRQALMERFNADKRIFCFILSTRSGGIGVNLTGADTVIFYDSDWNPTMDAQAQDRCHRIGQTRDVHIYRLISERTVEENILKKANQKRMLGNLAIEGGNFTSAYFQRNTVEELFGVELAKELRKGKSAVNEEPEVKPKPEAPEKYSQVQLEHALGMAEEDLDVQAAKTARAEAAAEFAEFDESIPLETDIKEIEEKSQAEEELDKLMDQLTPVEKYAMLFLESIQEPFSLEQLKLAEEEIEAQKKDWELGRLKALKEEEERRTEELEEEEENTLTYTRQEANQVDRKSRSIRRNLQQQIEDNNTPLPPQRRSRRIKLKLNSPSITNRIERSSDDVKVLANHKISGQSEILVKTPNKSQSSSQSKNCTSDSDNFAKRDDSKNMQTSLDRDPRTNESIVKQNQIRMIESARRISLSGFRNKEDAENMEIDIMSVSPTDEEKLLELSQKLKTARNLKTKLINKSENCVSNCNEDASPTGMNGI